TCSSASASRRSRASARRAPSRRRRPDREFSSSARHAACCVARVPDDPSTKEEAMEQLHTDRTLNKPRDIPARAEEIATDARVKLNETVQAVSGKARDAARYTDQVVQSNPWTSVGVGFGVGVVFGALLAMAINSQRSYISRIV